MAGVCAELNALRQQQAELHMAAADVGSAARLAAAEQQLADVEQALQQADAEHSERVERLTQQLNKVGSIGGNAFSMLCWMDHLPRPLLHFAQHMAWPQHRTTLRVSLALHVLALFRRAPCRTSRPMNK